MESSLAPSIFGDHYFPTLLARQRLRLASVLLVLKTIAALINSSSSVLQSDHKGGSSLGVKFYKDSEVEIRQALESFSKSELEKEVKLTRVESNGISFFYPFQGASPGKHYFSWEPQKNQKNFTSSSDKNLVIGLSNQTKSPFGWMSSTFFALRKYETSSKSSKSEQMHYYAMVVYVRKDAGRIELEWDRWSPNMGKALESRKAFQKTIDYMTIITHSAVLCAYGTCSCVACNNCSKESEKDENGEQMGSASDISAEIREYNNMNLRDAEMMFGSSKRQSLKTPKTNAHSRAIVSGKKGFAKATSFANSYRGAAMAESVSDSHGSSIAVAKGRKNSVADSKSTDGMARALTMTNHGFAQSSSQSSFGGTVESIAGKTGIGDKDYDTNYDDIEMDKDEEEEFDAENLFKETNHVFEVAEKRTHFTKWITKGDISSDMCLKEREMAEKMDHLELTTILQGEKEMDKPKQSTTKTNALRRKAPLRFGMDVDYGVNESIILASRTFGFAVKHEDCCQLKSKNADAFIINLLDEFDQSCSGSLQDVVSELEKFNFSQIKMLMQTKKVSPIQHRSLVPLLILRNFMSLDSEKLRESITTIQDLFNNVVSKKITITSAIIVNIAHFASVQGSAHKVKIFKGLADNAQSVWTGILLEYKKCIERGSLECLDKYIDKLISEMNLALGTYLFLKYADARFTTMDIEEGENPVHTFVSFMQLHNVNIAKQVYCKTKRLA